MRDKIIAAGVRNLKEFGYPEASAQNILTDQIYRAFFKSMLEDNLGKGADKPVKALLEEIQAKDKAPLP